tara:strand:- start:3994 stop:4704 length:711 start_codon:yes stop_codon:yes gene_type:complete
MPAYKEEEFIEQVLTELINEFKEKKFELEVIVVIDVVPGDKTLEIVESLSKKYNEIKIVTKPGKNGVGNAVRTGIKNISKEVTLITTAEVSETPKDLCRIASKVFEGYDFVVGNRFFSGAKRPGYALKKYFANRLCNKSIRLLFGIPSNDITNGIKAYKSEILKNMNLTSYGFELFAEIPIKAFLNGYQNIGEVYIEHFARDEKFSKFELTKEGPRFFKIVMKCFFLRQKFSRLPQ